MQEDPVAEKLRATAPRGYQGDYGLIASAKVIRTLDVDSYYKLSFEDQEKVDEWLEKYDLIKWDGMATTINQIENWHDWVIEVWGVVPHRNFQNPNSTGHEFPFFYDRNGDVTSSLLATFQFDDFPWEVLD